jgi:D-sedoheptulose 7-phosphate isomerase
MTLSIAQHLKESSGVKIRAIEIAAPAAEQIAQKLAAALKAGKKMLVFGNGGSAADAQHFAAELVGRFETERQPLAAIALTTDTSILTAVGNDYGYDHVFVRQVGALTQAGDVVIAMSTSGNSSSVLKAVEVARQKGAWIAGFSGMTGGKLKVMVDCCICVPSPRTAYIQETHIALIHGICAIVDAAFVTTPIA